MVDHSEFHVVKLLDAATPKLFSEDFDFQPQLTTEPTAPAGEVNHSEFAIVKRLDATTPTFSEDAFVFDGTQLAIPDGTSNTAPGEPVTFTYTVRADPSAYEGSHVLYQDVFVPPLETGPAVAMETLTIAHEGYWLV